MNIDLSKVLVITCIDIIILVFYGVPRLSRSIKLFLASDIPLTFELEIFNYVHFSSLWRIRSAE
jgi:hypothetical protein